MNNIYLYADESSLEVLLNEQQKAILIGSDFGYGNFGDVLQHLNAGRLIKGSSRYATISVMAANAIGFAGFPSWSRSAYGSDAVVYVADYPLILDEHSPPLKLVGEIRNLAVVHLYGGGFLNDMWGDYVLSVTEYFLSLASGIEYLVSGQQVTPPFQSKVIKHIKEFSPRIFGVRDEWSQQCLRDAGFIAHFSFDDATEALMKLSADIHLKREGGVLLHLNSSDYTANISLRSGIGFELSRLREAELSRLGVTVFQAFRDSRQEVFDSTETIKKLDVQFPFHDLRVVDLVSLVFRGGEVELNPGISGELGYSCSYHVALWLQLAGIPCWLRSNNAFYGQKSRALQVTQGLEEFLHEPKLADHRFNLERRSGWRELLSRELLNLPDIRNLCKISEPKEGPAPWPFFFKGTPTLEEKISQSIRDRDYFCGQNESAREELQQTVKELQASHEKFQTLDEQLLRTNKVLLNQRQRAEAAEANLARVEMNLAALSERFDALGSQLTEVGHEAHKQRRRAEIAEVHVDNVKTELFALNERFSAVSAQLTEVGHEAHQQRQRAETAELCMTRKKEETVFLERRLMVSEADRQQMLGSRSWKLTKPFRAVSRFVRTGRFDSCSEVGLFVALQRTARHFPIPSGFRRKLGRLLLKFRRR